MEHILRCNTLKCRQELNDRALVTTCSHCFCVACANQFQLLTRQDGQYPACPACNMHLNNPDDAVLTTLNPTEDYKTSVLSGLSPNIIVECAGRALSFWAYQTTQEIVYQEYCTKNLTNKYAALNAQLDKIIHDANTELSNLRSKISSMQSEQDILRQKNRDLAQQLRDRVRKHHETQELYDKMKRRSLLDHVQEAASDAVEQTIQNSMTTNRYMDTKSDQNPNISQPPLFPSHKTNILSDSGPTICGASKMQTPSTHRTNFPSNFVPGKHQPPPRPINRHDGTFLHNRYRISPREPLTNINNNSGGFAGYGMSAGLKVSNITSTGPNGLHRPIPQSRVSQRQPSGYTEDENLKFNIQRVIPSLVGRRNRKFKIKNIASTDNNLDNNLLRKYLK